MRFQRLGPRCYCGEHEMTNRAHVHRTVLRREAMRAGMPSGCRESMSDPANANAKWWLTHFFRAYRTALSPLDFSLAFTCLAINLRVHLLPSSFEHCYAEYRESAASWTDKLISSGVKKLLGLAHFSYNRSPLPLENPCPQFSTGNLISRFFVSHRANMSPFRHLHSVSRLRQKRWHWRFHCLLGSNYDLNWYPRSFARLERSKKIIFRWIQFLFPTD